MGQILSQPETEKHSEVSADKYLAYGLSCMQGWRINMEDAHATILNVNEDDEKKEHIAFFGVYDGHGGEKSAIFTGLRLHDLVCATEDFQKKDYVNALKNGFLSCDQAILQDFETRNDESGCAATSAIITPNQIICGNAGDSRTVMSINGFAKALSYDHKPFNEGEKARITAGGGYVDVGRVNGNLALSRGIGDFSFKKNTELPAEEQIVTCYPDVISHNIDFEKDEFVILACDGIWDCLSSQNCVECVRRGIYERKPFTQICEEIMELCCAPTSDGSGIGCDNMSILIVALLDYENNETLDQWYDKIIKKVDLHKEQMEAIKGKEDDSNAYLSVEYGPISPVYNDMYKEIFGEYYNIGQQGSSDSRSKGSNGYSMFGNMGGSRDASSNTEEDTDEDSVSREKSTEEHELDTGAISLQKLLSSNVITNENGVIYLDTSSAQSLLASFGMNSNSAEEGDEQDNESEDDSVHQKHIEEVDDEDNESETTS
ncbi:hypothetical protein JCM33374_g474 [Metschnikowia sp. JCM 33374]|nr:hypothetical protein JCM33374_g474 [Metschnikowia sp. JCM 33374]